MKIKQVESILKKKAKLSLFQKLPTVNGSVMVEPFIRFMICPSLTKVRFSHFSTFPRRSEKNSTIKRSIYRR